MILSFHPIIEAHENIICAGRAPDAGDLAAIQRAQAVILPQGCVAALYQMARDHCPNVFPNLDVRFANPGKRGQIRLFRKLGVAHPGAELFSTVDDFYTQSPAMQWPAVVKLDWGGQGETVFKADTAVELECILNQLQRFESSGQSGFLVQQYIPAGQRSLRVALIGRHPVTYWRIQPIAQLFGTSVADGARIDHDADPPLRAAAEKVVRQFAHQTGLQLAGFDFLFDQRVLEQGRIEPLMLEINYFFGRTGIGGSERYYQILTQQADAWLADLGLSRG